LEAEPDFHRPPRDEDCIMVCSPQVTDERKGRLRRHIIWFGHCFRFLGLTPTIIYINIYIYIYIYIFPKD
jgi:hypothetical protein